MNNTSVIICFYNRIDYLRLVLAGFENQTEQNFEVIIADDGSDKEIVNQLDKLISEYHFRKKHIWHEDKGFRKNRVLNKAILASESDYLIFIDGDCIPHSHFVEGHLSNAKKNFILTGRRVNLSQEITNQLNLELIKQKYLERKFYKVIFDGIFGKSIDVEKGFHLKNKLLLKYFNRKQRGLLGCNFSLYKDELLEETSEKL